MVYTMGCHAGVPGSRPTGGGIFFYHYIFTSFPRFLVFHVLSKLLILWKETFSPYFMHVIDKNSRPHDIIWWWNELCHVAISIAYCNLATSIVNVVCTSPGCCQIDSLIRDPPEKQHVTRYTILGCKIWKCRLFNSKIIHMLIFRDIFHT